MNLWCKRKIFGDHGSFLFGRTSLYKTRFTNGKSPAPFRRGGSSRGPETSRSRPVFLRFLRSSESERLLGGICIGFFDAAGFLKFDSPVIPKLGVGGAADATLYIFFANPYGRSLVCGRPGGRVCRSINGLGRGDNQCW